MFHQKLFLYSWCFLIFSYNSWLSLLPFMSLQLPSYSLIFSHDLSYYSVTFHISLISSYSLCLTIFHHVPQDYFSYIVPYSLMFSLCSFIFSFIPMLSIVSFTRIRCWINVKSICKNQVTYSELSVLYSVWKGNFLLYTVEIWKEWC